MTSRSNAEERPWELNSRHRRLACGKSVSSCVVSHEVSELIHDLSEGVL